MVELRARFDEQNNIDWSKQLEDAGCTVFYGFDDYKVHSKLTLITSRVNGELRQDSTTDLMIFHVAYVIAELSRGMTLLPGTIISMGTPAGVGMGFDPPKWLHPGDEVACSIEGIGTLTNTVR